MPSRAATSSRETVSRAWRAVSGEEGEIDFLEPQAQAPPSEGATERRASSLGWRCGQRGEERALVAG